MVSVEQKSAGTSSVQVHIPASLLCDFTYGRPRHAGYIVHRSAWTHQGKTSSVHCAILASNEALTQNDPKLNLQLFTEFSPFGAVVLYVRLLTKRK